MMRAPRPGLGVPPGGLRGPGPGRPGPSGMPAGGKPMPSAGGSLGAASAAGPAAVKGPTPPKMMMKSGGYVKAADGCAQRGKTKGRMI